MWRAAPLVYDHQERMSQISAKIGVIGGSGLYSMPGFSAQQEVKLATPFGDPSDAYIVGELEGKPVAFLARHGRGHRISPSERSSSTER